MFHESLNARQILTQDALDNAAKMLMAGGARKLIDAFRGNADRLSY
jgi:hypothetical protein